MRTTMSLITAAAILSGGSFAAIQAQGSSHVLQNVTQAQWGAAPPILPAGAEIAVLSGDPMAAGPYAIRLKFPANYVIPAHSHPTDENVVIVSGAVTFGMGDAVKKGAKENTSLRVGGYALMPANMNHFAYTGAQPATIVLYGQGPVAFKYVKASDDPRNKK
jgi:quercetin dioxygenase-like cupin family protein